MTIQALGFDKIQDHFLEKWLNTPKIKVKVKVKRYCPNQY
jgi:hypothetical protein